MKKHVEGILWAVALSGPVLAAQTSLKAVLALIAFASVSALLVVVPLHFWRAWRRLSSVPNPSQYAVWVGVETLFTVALVSGCVYMASAR